MALARSALRFASNVFLPTFGLAALVGGAHRAHADETPPQLHGVGETVNLSIIGANITLPAAPAGWAISRRIDSNTSYDVLRRQDPTNPQLEIRLNRPTSPSCASIATAFAKIGLQRHDPSAIAPPNWESWAFELPSSDNQSEQKLCTNTASGPVLATVVYEGTVKDLEPFKARPILEEVGAAIGGRRGDAGGIGVAPVTDGSGVTTLPITGIKIVLPSGWSVRSLTLDSGKKVDLIARDVPKHPELMVSVNRLPGSCSLPAMQGTYAVTDPPWLPSGFKSVARVKADGAITAGVMCADLGSEFALVVVTYEGSLTHPDVLAVRSILAPVTEQQTAVGGSMPSSPDTPASAYSGDDEPKAKQGHLELMGFQISPPGDGDKLSGGWAAIGALQTSNKGDFFGVGVELDLGIGYGTKKAMPWDVKLGGGPSFLIGPVMLLPLAGVGADGIGGQDDGFKLKGGAYYYYGGRAGVHFSPKFGLEGFVTAHRRAGDAPLDRELRWGATAMFKGWGLGLRMTEFGEEAVVRMFSAGVLIKF